MPTFLVIVAEKRYVRRSWGRTFKMSSMTFSNSMLSNRSASSRTCHKYYSWSHIKNYKQKHMWSWHRTCHQRKMEGSIHLWYQHTETGKVDLGNNDIASDYHTESTMAVKECYPWWSHLQHHSSIRLRKRLAFAKEAFNKSAPVKCQKSIQNFMLKTKL